MNVEHFDWWPSELFEPIWIGSNAAVCLEGVPTPSNAFVIYLRNSEVFGTGGHPATRAVISKLMARDISPSLSVIDFKCGTGLLGIICAKFGTNVTFMDSDRNAIEEAVENCSRNDCAPAAASFKAEKGPKADILVTHQSTFKNVKKYASDMHRVTKGGATLILSGHRANEHRAVTNILSEFFTIENSSSFEGWPVIIARRDK